MSLSLTGIHHCSVVVSDPTRARAFYRDVLGLKEIPRPSTFGQDRMGVIWFVVGDEHLHLIPQNKADSTSPRHFALHVADAKTARVSLRGKDLTIRETTIIPGADRFFISDPDANSIEFIEWKEPYPSSGR